MTMKISISNNKEQVYDLLSAVNNSVEKAYSSPANVALLLTGPSQHNCFQ